MDPVTRDCPADDDPAPDAVDFVSLGMFIIDDIEYLPPRPPVRDILGGAGAYAALGARLFSPAPRLSRTVGWIVDQGSDFPAAMGRQIDAWQSAVVLRQDDARLTTRGWNGYDVAEKRAFRYLTPKRRLTAADLPPALLLARAVHIVSSAERCRELVTELLRLRAEFAEQHETSKLGRPFVVWEPVPDRCSPDELLACTNTLPLVDVCSPNHAELAAYMGDPDAGLDPDTGRLSRPAVERACEQLLSSMPLQSYAIVVRAAEHGCYLAQNAGRHRRQQQQKHKHKQNHQPPPPPPPLHMHQPRPSQPKLHLALPLLTHPLPGRSSTPHILPDDKDEAAGKRPDKETDTDEEPAPEPAAPPSRRPKQNLHGGLRPDIDMEALFADLQQDDDGVIAREVFDVDPGLELWVPAVFGPGETTPDGKSPVVDPTGGGNAFLGALALALARGRSLEEAAVWGNVAASFAIQQVGVAELAHDDDGRETWNGERVEDRWTAYEDRLRRKGLLGGIGGEAGGGGFEERK